MKRQTGSFPHRWLIAAGLVLLVFGAKLWLVDSAGSSLPYRDQIDAEGESVLRPWAEGRLTAAAFWAPHNEHRIVWTKLLSWLGVTINGQWDVYVQVSMNALLHAGLLLLLLRWLRGQVEGWRYGLLASVATLLWLLPLDWENTLGGFQSQVYFVLGLSFLQLWGVLSATRRDWRWWGGHLCGGLALGAMASGVLSSIALLAVVAIEAGRRRKVSAGDFATIAITTFWIVVALWSRVTVEGHDSLKADSVGGFIAAAAEVASWPLQHLLPWSLAIALPVVFITFSLVRNGTTTAAQRVLLGLLFWMALTVAATAWLRGNGSPLISRYLTTYYFLLILAGVAITLIPLRRWRDPMLVIWALVIMAGLTTATLPTVKKRLPGIAQRAEASTGAVRDFLASGDESVIRSASRAELPYPSAEVLIDRWSHDSIRALLPAAVRPPIPIAPAENGHHDQLPAPPYPVIAASPLGAQVEPWRWRSERQPDTALPVLRFRFNGGLGDPETALRLRIVSDLEAVEVIPDGPARQRWKTINVMRPRGEWWIEVEDSDTIDRIALTAPTELGWLSWGAEKLIKFHFWWFSAGSLLILGGLLGGLRRQDSPAEASANSAPLA